MQAHYQKRVKPDLTNQHFPKPKMLIHVVNESDCKNNFFKRFFSPKRFLLALKRPSIRHIKSNVCECYHV